MQELMKATKQARKRTGKNIATRIKQGKIQIVEVIYKDGKTIENELSEWMAGSSVISALNQLS